MNFSATRHLIQSIEVDLDVKARTTCSKKALSEFAKNYFDVLKTAKIIYSYIIIDNLDCSDKYIEILYRPTHKSKIERYSLVAPANPKEPGWFDGGKE